MPYSRTLQHYLEPGFSPEVPAEWARRLREISDVTDRMAHLRFRRFDPHEGNGSWHFNDRPIWVLYSCTPRHLVTADAAQRFDKHWSELPDSQQAGRESVASNYQHFMWHAHGVEAMPFWVLQGEWGGTAAQYTPREKRYLDACNALSDPFPLGFFPACPFDERAVRKIQERDRFLAVGKQLDALEKRDRPAALKAEDDAAEYLYRQTFLDNWFATIQPQAEFMQTYLRKSEADMTLPKATREQANTVTMWQDHFLEHGHVPGVGVARSRAVNVTVGASI